MPQKPQRSSGSTPAALRAVGLLPRLALTRVLGTACRARVPAPLRSPLYRLLADVTGADLAEAERAPEEFATVDDYFTRTLRPGLRPQVASGDVWTSPADGGIAQVGRLRGGRLLQAKGISYRASELLGDLRADDTFDGGCFATVYLSPADYHRVHAPVGMKIHDVVHLGGDLWPVNGISVPWMENLFVQNERIVARFRDPRGRSAALVMVGATVVGGISLSRDIGMRRDHDVVQRRVHLEPPWTLRQGEEFGRFHIGSTVVLLVQDHEAPLRVRAEPGSVRIGEALFQGG